MTDITEPTDSKLSWNETIRIMKEVNDLYLDTPDCPESDVATVNAVDASIADAKNASAGLHTTLGEDVGIKKALVKEAEERIEREREGDYQAKMQELKIKEAKLKEQFRRIEEERGVLQARIVAAEKGTKEEKAKIKEIEKKNCEELPRIRHAISLFANISSMKMDDGAPDWHIMGTVALPDQEEVHIFNVEAKAMGPFKTTKEMWRLMDEGRPADSGLENDRD